MQIPLAKPDVGPQEEAAVISVLRSGCLSMGPWTERFEAAVAERVKTRFGVACSSGTAGLHLLLTALGIGPGDEVITPSFSFIASSNAILYTGARPVFVEIEERTLCIDPNAIEAAITPRTRAILPVDVFGHPAPLPAVRELADRFGLHVVEDACEALGSTLDGVPCGNGRFAHGAVFAFYPNKQITTGEGGMIVTDDEHLAARCRSLRNHGREEGGAWLSHARLGFNYRMDEMSAALGTVQMARLDPFIQGRERVAAAYERLLSALPEVATPFVASHVQISRFVYVVRLSESVDRDAVMAELLGQGVGCRPYFTPIHLQPFYQEQVGSGPGDLPITEQVAASTIALPFHANLSTAEVEIVVEALARAVDRCRRSAVGG